MTEIGNPIKLCFCPFGVLLAVYNRTRETDPKLQRAFVFLPPLIRTLFCCQAFGSRTRSYRQSYHTVRDHKTSLNDFKIKYCSYRRLFDRECIIRAQVRKSFNTVYYGHRPSST